MLNHQMVKQWASSVRVDKCLKEFTDFKAKYPWSKLDETTTFILKMAEDLHRITHIIELQEVQNDLLRKENHKLRKYIEVNQMADELIIDDLRKKFNIEI
jgi:hypothetical protein